VHDGVTIQAARGTVHRQKLEDLNHCLPHLRTIPSSSIGTSSAISRINRISMVIRAGNPDRFQDLPPRDRLPRLSHQGVQQAALGGGELDPLRTANRLRLTQLDPRSTDVQRQQQIQNHQVSQRMLEDVHSFLTLTGQSHSVPAELEVKLDQAADPLRIADQQDPLVLDVRRVAP
jgi:hypothetical protein